MLFCVLYLGFHPRSLAEQVEPGGASAGKARDLIAASKFSIHDFSRRPAEGGGEHDLPDTPAGLEILPYPQLYAEAARQDRKLLILAEDPGPYRELISRYPRSEIMWHKGRHDLAIRCIRSWLPGVGNLSHPVPAPRKIIGALHAFQEWYYDMAALRRARDGIPAGGSREDAVEELAAAMAVWVERVRR